MKKGTLLAVASVALALCMLAGYTGIDAQTAAAPDKTIVQTAQENADLSTLVTALQTAGLVDTLNGQGPFTVFAPTNEAFAKLDPALLQQLLTTDVSTLREILLYHVVAGQIISTQLENGQEVKTVQGAELKVTVNASGTFINDAMVIIPDVMACNGVIHVIDTVLIPPSPVTPSVPECPPVACPDENNGSSEGQTIAQIAASNPDLSTLVTALETAGLVDTLNGPGEFTVFAPTNEAFAKLDPALLQQLLTTDVSTLREILLYHVVSGEVLSSQLVNLGQLTTLQGQTVTVTVGCDTVCINDAMVIVKDIQASNGVIHVIDTVLLPPSGGGC